MGFAGHIDVLFNNPNLAQGATYEFLSGGLKSIRVIRYTPGQKFDGWGAGAITDAYMADIRVSDIEQWSDGDQLTIGSEYFTVRNGELDTERLVWKLELDIE